VLSGAQCLETSEGIIVVRAAEGAVVKQGPSMITSSVGTDTRRAVGPSLDHSGARLEAEGPMPEVRNAAHRKFAPKVST